MSEKCTQVAVAGSEDLVYGLVACIGLFVVVLCMIIQTTLKRYDVYLDYNLN